MNNTSLFECTVAPKNESRERTLYLIFKIAKIVFFICTAIVGIFAFNFSNEMWILCGVFLIHSLILAYLQRKFYAFYDYSFTDGEVKFVKVINNKARKLLTKLNVKDITKLGFVSSSEFEIFLKDKECKKIYAKSKSLAEDNVYMQINQNGEKKLVIFEYNQKFLYAILKRATNKILDSEFAKAYEKFNLS